MEYKFGRVFKRFLQYQVETVSFFFQFFWRVLTVFPYRGHKLVTLLLKLNNKMQFLQEYLVNPFLTGNNVQKAFLASKLLYDTALLKTKFWL